MISDINFIMQKYQELKTSKEIIIFLKSSEYSYFDINLFNQKYQDAKAFLLFNNNEQIIFIKQVKNFKKINYRELSKEADRAFTKKDYESAIKLYEILLLQKKPNISVYARLGLSYFSQNNINKALIFFKIATGMSYKTKKNKYDFTALINKITRKKEEDKFTNDLTNFYGLTKVKDVILLIEFHGMNIDEACMGLKINDNDKNIITLIIARDCYAQKDMSLGDKYIKKVEKAKNKSLQVKNLLEEIKLNKIFYQNRVDESYKPLIRARY